MKQRTQARQKVVFVKKYRLAFDFQDELFLEWNYSKRESVMSYQEKAGWVRPTVETMGTRKTMVGSIPFTVETVDLDGNPVHNDSGAS